MPRRVRKVDENKYQLTVSDGFDDAGRRICHYKTITATSERAAEKQYFLFAAEIEKTRKTADKTMTLHEFFAYYNREYADKHNAISTRNLNKTLFVRIDKALGRKHIGKITVQNIIEFLGNLGISPNYTKKHYDLLNKLFAKAVQWRIIVENPMSFIDTPKLQKVGKKIYDEETCKYLIGLLEKEPARQQLLVYVPLFGGLRRGEIFGLQWKHVVGDTLIIEQECEYQAGTGIYIKSTKTGIEHTVSIPHTITEKLMKLKEQQRIKKDVLANQWKGAKDIEDNFVFCNWNGKPVNPQSMNKWLTRFLQRNKMPHITPHSFRHMMATYLIAAGVDLQTVSGKLGHSNTITTQRIYSHYLKSHETKTATILQSMLSVGNKLGVEVGVDKEKPMH